jgi:ADP-ribose pyrophosphatase YjhB (NUDIX family)
MKLLLKIWRIFPWRLQEIASRIIRPLFQVFAVAAIFDAQGKLLLVKSTYQRYHPWGLPGGSLEYGESPEEGVVREVWEETSLKIRIDELIFVKTWTPDRVGLYYLCHIESGSFHPSDEVSEFGYFSKNELPDVRPLDIEVIKQVFDEVNK